MPGVSKKGRLWAPDYFDRFVRNERHFENARYYIENNPVKAWLVGRPEDWPCSFSYGVESNNAGWEPALRDMIAQTPNPILQNLFGIHFARACLKTICMSESAGLPGTHLTSSPHRPSIPSRTCFGKPSASAPAMRRMPSVPAGGQA